MLKLEQVGYRYAGGHTGLQGVSVTAEPGDIVGIVGPNGSGKSTLLRLLNGELPVQHGTLALAGDVLGVQRSRVQRGSIRLLTQDPSLDPEMTVRELLQMFAALYGIPRAASSQQIEACLQAFGIADLALRRIAHLSGGQRQRVHICVGLLGTPQIVLLDEPANNLDAAGQQVLWQQMDALRQAGSICLLVTHQVQQVARHCTQTWIMQAGRIVAAGDPAQLVADRPQADLVELVDTLVGPVDAGTLQGRGPGQGRGGGRGRGMG